VRGPKLSSPTRPKASHPVGSRTEGRPRKRGVRSRGKARTQAASLNPEKCIMVDNRISPGNRTQSRRCARSGRQQSCSRQGKRAGHHRGLRAGHVGKRVIRELGRASRLLGNNRRSKGDRRNQHPGVCWLTWPADEPTLVQTGRDTNHSASTQGAGREPKADRPGRTEAVGRVSVLTIDTNQPPASTHCATNTLAPSSPLTPSPPKPERGPIECPQFHSRAFQPAIPTAGPTRWPGPALRAAPPESAPRLLLAGRR